MLPMGHSLLQLGQSGLLPGLSGMGVPNSPLTSWQQQLLADTPRGQPSPRGPPPPAMQQQAQQAQQAAQLPPLAPRQAQQQPPQPQQPAPQQHRQQAAAPQQAPQPQQAQQAQQAEPDAPADQLLRLLQPSPFDSTATAAQKAAAQVR